MSAQPNRAGVLQLCPRAGLEQLFVVEEFVCVQVEAEVLGLLAAAPVLDASDWDPTERYAFMHPVYDGVKLARRESAAGNPVWFRGAAVRAVPMPEPLGSLRSRVDAAAQALVSPSGPLPAAAAHFTSVYVDEHRPGGGFVPHTDRDIYGPVVACVSLGPGQATLRLSDGKRSVDTVIPPRSLYFMLGQIRWQPWVHSVHDVTDLRYAATFRSAAAVG